MERVGIVAFAADVRIGAAFEQQLGCRFAVAKDGVMKRRPHTLATALVNQLRMRIEQRIQSHDVPFSSGIPQRRDRLRGRAGCFQRLDVRLQLGPGRESIFARDHQLRFRKRERRRGDLVFGQVFPARMALANASQSLRVLWLLAFQQGLGLFPELFKTGARRKLP